MATLVLGAFTAVAASHECNSPRHEVIRKISGKLGLLLVMAVPLDGSTMLANLRARELLHFVGAVLEPIPINAFDIIMSQRSVSRLHNGSPPTTAQMFEIAARNDILPQTEHFPIARGNDAVKHLLDGKARYRVVLDM